MDKAALTEKRGDSVVRFLKSLEIRRVSDNGYDMEDVHECIHQLCRLYETHIGELEKNYDTEIEKLTAKYQKYEENNELYVDLIVDAKRTAGDIISQAQNEVDSILEEGKEKIALCEREQQKLEEEFSNTLRGLEEEVAKARENAEAEKIKIAEEIDKERENLEETRRRYRTQVDAMDEEFNEIKTNIWRAAAKLDGLKAQTENVEEDVQWKLEESSSVEIPVNDTGIEEILIDAPVEETEPAVFTEEEFLMSEIPSEEAAGTEAKQESEEIPDVFTELDLEHLQSMIDEHTEETAETAETVEAAETEEPKAAEAEEIIPEDLAELIEQSDLIEKTEEDTASVEELLGEINFDDILAEVPETQESAEEDIAEISLENLEETEVPEAEEDEEISFKKLEELFKNEK
ncbi:MAG: hypothetical protein PUB75_07275 [Firmicutes bacterium]|nr:hypothetical protein [Bacillota bacterium]